MLARLRAMLWENTYLPRSSEQKTRAKHKDSSRTSVNNQVIRSKKSVKKLSNERKLLTRFFKEMNSCIWELFTSGISHLNSTYNKNELSNVA